MEIRIAGVIKESIVDGHGVRFVVFSQGCPHNCPGCQNPQTHDFSGGNIADTEKIVKAIMRDPLLSGVTFSGGEPFAQAKPFVQLAKEIRAANPSLDITAYSGYTFEELLNKSEADKDIAELLAQCDVLIDGKYIESERDLTLQFRGSRNQRLIDVKKSLEHGEAVLLEYGN